ncbi:MAG TPA: acyl-ACP thioesterase domain-containing protein [Acidimicrobiales bacterium]|nr:acyl-ACP thioesterase domain-containing protein [Acidimicrobiales bacterium]
MRQFTGTRTVRLGDVGLRGLLRLDALARFLQDIAADDAADVGLRDASWVVRRTVLTIDGRPRYGERISLATSCGGLGSRWAERRTDVVGPTSRIEASSLWVHLDPAGRPAALPERFLEAYAETAAGRTVSSRLTLAGPPEGAPSADWPLRPTDFDVLGHVNNAVSWAIVEDEPLLRGTATLEYRTPIEPGADVRLVADGDRRWLVSASGVHSAARLERS